MGFGKFTEDKWLTCQLAFGLLDWPWPLSYEVGYIRLDWLYLVGLMDWLQDYIVLGVKEREVRRRSGRIYTTTNRCV
jgi:hypothetical protein